MIVSINTLYRFFPLKENILVGWQNSHKFYSIVRMRFSSSLQFIAKHNFQNAHKELNINILSFNKKSKYFIIFFKKNYSLIKKSTKLEVENHFIV